MSDPTEGDIVNQNTPVQFMKTKHPAETVELLEAAFHNMFNITEACQYAGISTVTYYNWLGDDDIFSFRMSIAQQAPNKKAKENIMAALLAGDTSVSRWYLERRDPEFKPRGELELQPGPQKTEEKLKEFMDDTDDGAYPSSTNDVSSEPVAPPQPEGGDEVAPCAPAIQE